MPPVWTLTNVKYNTYKRGLPEQYTSLATTAQTTVTVNGDTPGAQRLQSAILITDSESDDENNYKCSASYWGQVCCCTWCLGKGRGGGRGIKGMVRESGC